MITISDREELTRLATEQDVRTAAGWKKLLKGYKPMNVIQEANMRAWKAAMERAGAEIDRLYPGFNWKDGEKLETQTMMAENMMVDSLQTPPHWTSVVRCKKCGPMPFSEDIKDALACPWCAVMNQQERKVA